MDDSMEAVHGQENPRNVEVNSMINEVVNKVVNLSEHWVDTMESRMEELREQHDDENCVYKARILNLENQVPKLTMAEAGSSSSIPIAPTNNHLQSLLAERDIAVHEAKIAKSQAMEVCTWMDVMKKKMVDMQQQLQVVNEMVVDHKIKIGELEEQNAVLKKHLRYAIVERKNMTTCTLLATAKARQFEAEFESIQKEWNRNH